MGAKSRFLGAVAVSLAAVGLAACGSSGSTTAVGVGTITVTAFAPNPIPGGLSVPFTITGFNFQTTTGNTVIVRFHALNDLTPFGAGTEGTAEVEGRVDTDTSISGTTPVMTLCGAASVSLEITVILESGVQTTFSGGGVPIVASAPTVTSVSVPSFGGGNTVPALVPTAIEINGTNFAPAAGPFGGTATVKFTGDANAGVLPHNFSDGTANEIEVTGTIVSATKITATSPRSTNPLNAGAGLLAVSQDLQGASVQVTIDSNGSCSGGPGALNAIRFDRPDAGLAPLFAPQTIQTAYTLTSTGGTNQWSLGGGTVVVRFIDVTGVLPLAFQSGTQPFAETNAAIVSPLLINGTTPLAFKPTAFNPNIRVVFEDGTVMPVTDIRLDPPPIVTNVSTNLLVREFGAAPANRSFLTETETFMTITGTNFNGAAVALVYKQANGPAGPIGTGALTSPTVTGSTTIAGGSPIDPSIQVDEQAEVRVTNPDGQSGTFTNPGFAFRVRGHLQNTNVSLQGGLNSEMEAAVDPTNPRNLATLSHGTNGPGDLRLAFSINAGRTWTQTNIGAAQDGGSAAQDRIDPRCAYDRFGNLYLVYFTRGPAPARTIFCLQSFDKGVTFPIANTRTVVVSAATDKEFLVTGVNGANPAQEAIYVGWDDGNTSGIIVSGATCAGAGVPQSAYSAPVQIVDNPGGTATQFSNACVGPNGDLHVVWIDLTTEPASGEGPVQVWYDRDPLGLFAGPGFGTDVFVATTNFGSFDSIPATTIRQTYCMPEVAAVLAGPSAGRVCITYGTENPDESNDADIVARFTDNGGVSFSAEIPVNDDGTATAQWQASVRADRATGTLVSAWYDSRNDIVNNQLLDIYASMSYDGGMTWQPNMSITDGRSLASNLANGNEYLDYEGLSIQGGMALVTWSDNSNSTGDNPNGVAQTENYASRFQFR